MTSGKVHDTTHRYLLTPTALAVFFAIYVMSHWGEYAAELAIMTYLGMQFNRFAGPDQDQNNANYFDFVLGFLDPVISKLWFWAFWPYGKLFKHRSIWSHGFIIGAVIRLIYIIIILSPVIVFADLLPYLRIYSDYIFFFAFGFIIGDSLHILLDYNLSLRQWAEKLFQ